jgi:hypothetical protein
MCAVGSMSEGVHDLGGGPPKPKLITVCRPD